MFVVTRLVARQRTQSKQLPDSRRAAIGALRQRALILVDGSHGLYAGNIPHFLLLFSTPAICPFLPLALAT